MAATASASVCIICGNRVEKVAFSLMALRRHNVRVKVRMNSAELIPV